MSADTDGNKDRKQLALEQVSLAAAGVIAFVLGVSVHSDRANLAVALAVFGMVLVVLATLLPRLKSIGATVGGTGFEFELVEPPNVTTDSSLAEASDARAAALPVGRGH